MQSDNLENIGPADPSDTAVWQPDLTNRARPVYLAIADALADDIAAA